MIDCRRRYEDSSAFFLEGVWGVADATSTCFGVSSAFFFLFISRSSVDVSFLFVFDY